MPIDCCQRDNDRFSRHLLKKMHVKKMSVKKMSVQQNDI